MSRVRKDSTQKRPKPGRPAYQPSDEERQLVSKLSGMGVKQSEICELIINDKTNRAISEDTLRKHFAAEIASGRAIAKSKVMKTAYRMAISGEVPAMTMFWLKTQAGWRETNHIDHTSSDGSMSPAGNEYDQTLRALIESDDSQDDQQP